MDHAGNLSFVFGLYRDAVPAVSHGDHRVLKIIAGAAVYKAGKLGVDALVDGFHASPDLAEGRACVIADFLF